MILSEKVAGIIKDLEVQVGIKDVRTQLSDATYRRPEQSEVYELVVEVADTVEETARRMNADIIT
jgi:hypothetical protein